MLTQMRSRMNFCLYPCPCGFFGDPERQCTCSMGIIQRYRKRLSGPLLDRIDIHMEVPRVDYDKLANATRGESSDVIRALIVPSFLLINTPADIPWAMLIAFLASSFSVFFYPARTALVPAIVEKDELMTANGWMQMGLTIARLCGASIQCS